MSTERLTDDELDELLAPPPVRSFFETMPNGGLIRRLARELRERRDAERAVAPAVENPYRFWVSVEEDLLMFMEGEPNPFLVWITAGDGECMVAAECATEAEARQHAALIAAALRNVEVEG